MIQPDPPETVMPRSFALGAYFEAFIDAQLKSGRYNNASEVVRDSLRLLEDREKLRQLKLAELRQMVQQGMDSGLSDEDPEAFFDRLIVTYNSMASETKA